MNNKKNYLYILGSVLLVLGILGITYGWFNYRRETGDQRLIAGDIYLRLNEGEEEITLTNIFPETEEEARARDDNYITFNIEGLNESTKDVYYEIVLNRGTNKSSPYVRFNDTDLRFDLSEIDSNGDEITSILSNVSYDSLVNQRIYVDTVEGGISTSIERRYLLRMWLSGDVIISDTDPNATYAATGYNNHYANIKVIVGGDFAEKSAPKQAYNLIKSLASTANYIGNYDTIIQQNQASGFTTQDTVGVNNNKKTVYYYTGDDAAANANVLFAGFCWQIVRTTDNGGVRMIYNGVAQKTVITSTPISNTDITYTNDGTYPYTYDAYTKKWTSTNSGVASSRDNFIFKVNTVGDYAINYKVSSQNYDSARIYIKPSGTSSYIYQTEYSGEVEGTFDLGTLNPTDEIKIEYYKNSSIDMGTDNIIFDIAIINTRGDTPVCAPDRRTAVTREINTDGNGTTETMTAASLFGRSFDYNLATGEFTIEDSVNLPNSWSTSDNNSNGVEDYKELIGTYTCLSNSTTCSTLYYVGGINQSNTSQAYVVKYIIKYGEHYSQIGKSSFNSKSSNPAMLGYMFNTEYNYTSSSPTGVYHTNAVWNPNSSLYELSSNDSSSTTPNAEHRYMCDSDCSKVRYYYYQGYYIVLENGETVADAVYKMTGYGDLETITKNSDYKLNNYNSAIKGYLDNWYKKNLATYTSYLDSTSVYCNDRSIRDLGGWNPASANFTGSNAYLKFKHYSTSRDLNCVNETDRFSITNSNAKLTYPIGLLTESERNLMTANFAKTGQIYWSGSIHYFNYYLAFGRYVYSNGNNGGSSAENSLGVRPVITINHSTLFESGSGTYTEPYIVGPIVDRNT